MVKQLEDLTFCDDYIFNRVMQNEKLCKRCIEMILGIEIDHIEKAECEQTIRPIYSSKGIRLDVYLKGDDVSYNVEMQNRSYKELPKRSRYYQSVMDVDALLRGATYRELQKNVVIFICSDDPFQKGRAIYTFENRCVEDPEYPLNDETLKVFLNAKGTRDGLSEGLKHFLDFVRAGQTGDEYTRQLNDEVRKVKSRDTARSDYMFFSAKLMDEHYEGFNEGKEAGGTEKEMKIAKRMHAKGKSTDEIAEMLDITVEKVQQLIAEESA